MSGENILNVLKKLASLQNYVIEMNGLSGEESASQRRTMHVRPV